MNGQGCNFSFDDLFEAAHGRVIASDERYFLFKLSQEERNKIVKA